MAGAQLGCVSLGVPFPLAYASLNNSGASKTLHRPNTLTLRLATIAKSQVSPPVFPGGLQPFLRAAIALLLGDANPPELSICLFKFSGSCELKDAFLSWILSACLQVFASMLLLLLYALVRGTQTLGHPCLRGVCGRIDRSTRRYYTC